MFTDPALAARIDRAEGRFCAGIARASGDDPAARAAVVEIAGGLAIFAGPGSPTNKLIGMGFDGLPDTGALDAVERLFAERGAPLQAEVATLAEPGLHALLVARGYEPRGFENVLGRPLAAPAEVPTPPGVAVARVDDADRGTWVNVVVAGFAEPDTGGVGGDEPPPSDALARWMALTLQVPGFECVLARVDGDPAGGAAFRLDDGLIQFCGAATVPRYRRRGIQSTLVRWRLAHAAAQGAAAAVVVTQPASKSQQNAQREGFSLLYARQLLVKQP
ncbi:MAG: GNAT family N-acetyltransferase [Vicinamibacterales bacterium]